MNLAVVNEAVTEMYGVVPGIITVGGWFELFFVNTLGCPFNTGGRHDFSY